MSETTTAPLSKNELLKQRIPTLAGNIAATINDPALEKFSEDDEQFIKFHGIYQQDDRDLRKTGKKWLVMIRGRIPGGVMNSNQWKVFDDLATQYGNDTLRITTRQSIQFHGVVKKGLGPLIKRINESMLSTLAACGDVNRNVTVSPTPATTLARAWGSDFIGFDGFDREEEGLGARALRIGTGLIERLAAASPAAPHAKPSLGAPNQQSDCLAAAL